MKRFLSVLSITAILFTSVFMLFGCSPKRPQIKITLSNGKELVYVLYKDYAPETVEHFLSLVEKGYYDNTALSDFQSGRIMAGDYEWNADFSDLQLKSTSGIDTVKGEINGVSIKVENNPLLHGFGTLSLYNDKTDSDEGSYDSGKVKFFISTGANASFDKNYAVFGKLLKSEHEEVLTKILEDKLTEAEDYAYEELNNKYKITLPSEPIYIKTITVIKK